jgi:microcystin-dependent protein
MSEPYVGQIEFFAFGYAPKGWNLCAGQLLPVSQNQALFALLGTTYGGNGTTNFQLPDLRSRVPVGSTVGAGSQGNWTLGETQGEENHTLLITEMPQHAHIVNAVSGQGSNNSIDVPGTTTVMAQAYQVGGAAANIYAVDSAPSQPMSQQALSMAGGNTPHSNMMPGLALNACIAMVGLFPSRS